MRRVRLSESPLVTVTSVTVTIKVLLYLVLVYLYDEAGPGWPLLSLSTSQSVGLWHGQQTVQTSPSLVIWHWEWDAVSVLLLVVIIIIIKVTIIIITLSLVINRVCGDLDRSGSKSYLWTNVMWSAINSADSQYKVDTKQQMTRNEAAGGWNDDTRQCETLSIKTRQIH